MNPSEIDKEKSQASDQSPSQEKTDGEQDALDQIAEDFAEAIRRGHHPNIEDFLEHSSGQVESLRSLLESIEIIEGLKHDTSKANNDSSHSGLQRLDDYKIIREIGRGGMGIVFEAIHESLGRRVAIKVLANSLLGDPKHLARFRREARAAAKLRHTNIVPVFGVGRSGDHHYYVMDFIDGISLQQCLDSLSNRRVYSASTVGESPIQTTSEFQSNIITAERTTPIATKCVPTDHGTIEYFRWVANIGATIGSALQYAHSQGVLHRDIKPANLLIDSDGQVWVADFGLAKLSEQQAVTMTGDIVGTPQYMPPESFEGNYDAKSEVYGLGLTLYELITLCPAIEGQGAADVIRKASEGVLNSPKKLQPKIPRDLETIILKSLAHDPRSRYVSAGELRDDLCRYLSDQSISARRSTSIERLARWSRREPAVALLTFATFTLLLALAIVSAIGFVRTTHALAQTKAANLAASISLKERTIALETADSQRVRAERNLQVALTAFDEIMKNIGQRGIEADAEFLGEVTDTTSPNVTPQDAELLNSLLGFFDDLAKNNSEDLLSESAVAARRSGDISLRLGQLQEAENSFHDSLERVRKLCQAEPKEVQHVITQAEILNELAVVTALRGKLGMADKMYYQTKSLLENSPIAMNTQGGQYAYARAHRLYGSHSSRMGLNGVVQAPKTFNERSIRRPMSVLLRLRFEDSLTVLDTAIETLDRLLDQHPDEVLYDAELARTYRDKATVASRLRLHTDAEVAVKKSIEIFDELLTENPNLDAIRYELALTLSSTEAFNWNQTMRAHRANELSSDLLQESPDLPRYKALRAHTLEAMAAQQFRNKRFEIAERNLREALQIYNDLIVDTPELVVYERRRSQALESMADIKIKRGEKDLGIEYIERAISRLQPRLRRKNVSPLVRMQLQRLNQKLTRLRESQ